MGFKPLPLLSSDGKLQFLRQEATVATSDRAQLVVYAQRSRKHDPYAIWPEMAFPYLTTLVRVANSKLFYDNHFAEKVWGNSKALDLMDAVIDRFVANTELYGSKPVVVFVDGPKSKYTQYVADPRDRYQKHPLVVIDVAEAEFDWSRYRVFGDTGHPSPYGNAMISKNIEKELLPTGLVE